MSWLQKRPQVSNPLSFTAFGVNQTLLIVGLGNIGKEYDGTRHNIGFFCLDNLAASLDEFAPWTDKKDLKCHLTTGQLADKRVILIKPTTLMNLSGDAVGQVVHFYKIDPKNIVVVHDDMDVEFGQIRTRVGGSSAGHNGIKSITKSLSTEDYGRVRIGVGHKKTAQMDAKDYVLGKFSDKEQKQLKNLSNEATAIITEYIYGVGSLVSETRSFLV